MKKFLIETYRPKKSYAQLSLELNAAIQKSNEITQMFADRIQELVFKLEELTIRDPVFQEHDVNVFFKITGLQKFIVGTKSETSRFLLGQKFATI